MVLKSMKGVKEMFCRSIITFANLDQLRYQRLILFYVVVSHADLIRNPAGEAANL